MYETPPIEWFKLAATVVVALIAALIAWRQYSVSKAKFRLDLFDKREPIFHLVWKACSPYVRNYEPNFARNAAIDMMNAVPKAEFLFGAEIGDYMREVYDRITALESYDFRARTSVADPNEEAEARRIIREAQAWLGIASSTGVKQKFGKYLDFKKWT